MDFMPRLFRRISIIDFINLFFLCIIIVFYLFAFNRTPYKIPLLIIYILLFVFIIFMTRLRESKKSHRRIKIIMFSYPVIFLFVIFETFFMILPYFNSLRFDALMANIDFKLLGVNPTVWIENWIHPLLTDILSLFYFFYFPMPFIIIGWMYKKAKFKNIEKALFIYFTCYYGAYICYFLIPVEGPRFFLREIQNVSLNGCFLTEPIRSLINIMEPNKLDAFPSLHAAILAVTMFVTYSNCKKMFYYFIPCVVGIIVSLVYLRYHYFIDVIAGLLWSIISCLLADRIYNKIHNNFNFHFWDSKL